MISALGSSNNMDSDPSIRERSFMKQEALRLWKESPIYGHGVNSFWVLSPITNGKATSHCGFTEILCSFGLIGFIIYYWHWFWTIIKKGWVNIKTKAKNKELSLFTIILMMIFVMEWQTTSFQSATTVSLLAVLFKILKSPKKFGF